MQVGDEMPQLQLDKLSSSDKWILSRFSEVLDHVTANMEKYELSMVGNELYNFVWDDFCSWYIELSKATLFSEDADVVKSTKAVLYTVMINILKLLSPFMPFVTEEIYLDLPHEKESLNVETWPEKIDFAYTEAEKQEMAIVMSAIETVREVKTNYDMKPSKDLVISLRDQDNAWIGLSKDANAVMDKMCHAQNVEELGSDDILSRTISHAVFTCAMGDLIDFEKEKTKLSNALEHLEKEIKRSTGMLNNKGFVAKAPAAKVQQEKDKLASYQEQYELTKKQYDELMAKA